MFCLNLAILMLSQIDLRSILTLVAQVRILILVHAEQVRLHLATCRHQQMSYSRDEVNFELGYGADRGFVVGEGL